MIKEAEIFHKRPAPIRGKIVPTPIGSMNYNVLRALIEEGLILKLNKGAEVGVFEATTSEYLLKSFKSLSLYCIDPYSDYSELEANRTQEKMNIHEQVALNKLSAFGDRVNFIKNFSVQASKQVEDESLDFVFIDALHTYEAVVQDLNAWYPKVRKGGLIAGHDFSWDGIKKAVEEFISKIGKSAFHSPSTSDVWFFIK